MGANEAAKEGNIILEAEMLRRRMLADARAVRLDAESEAIGSWFHRIGSRARIVVPQVAGQTAAQQFTQAR